MLPPSSGYDSNVSEVHAGGIMDLWSVGILPQHYTVSQPRRWRQHGPLKL